MGEGILMLHRKSRTPQPQLRLSRPQVYFILTSDYHIVAIHHINAPGTILLIHESVTGQMSLGQE